jgi:hypothetical protein
LFQAGDILIVRGEAESVARLDADKHLSPDPRMTGPRLRTRCSTARPASPRS